MAYPADDLQFEDKKIERVQKSKDGTFDITCDGWTLCCGKDCPVTPEIGQTARLYGRGIGYATRGLFIDGVKVWYRTEPEEKEYREIESYGADAADWLARWDAGQGVWSIEMGGLGPSYEQCIQITAAEVVRYLIQNKVDPTKKYAGEAWETLRDGIYKALWANKTISDLGLSGAQAGAAMNLGTMLYKLGPRGVMADEDIKDRHIQVSRDFPGMRAA